MLLKHRLKKTVKGLISIILVSLVSLFLLQTYFYEYTKKDLYTELEQVPQSDYVLILGCGVRGNEPTPLLRKRLEAGIELIKHEKADKIIVSGYRDGDYYDEVKVMKNYLVKNGIDENIIIEDKQGNNTYYSIKNTEKYQGESFTIVTQKWHLVRALYLAKKINTEDVFGFEADKSDSNNYTLYMNFRENFARIKAVMDVYGLHIE